MKDICIIGAGVTGLSMLLLLQESGIDMSNVCIIDPYFDGGDLARKWTAVQSNTPWSKTIQALKKACPSLKIDSQIELENTTPLVEIAHLLRNLSKSLHVKRIQGIATHADYNTTTQTWTVLTKISDTEEKIICKKLVLAPGSEPNYMDISIPSIPLEIAIDISRLSAFVKKGQKALVFGTMHSGTLVIRNLVQAGVDVTAYYNSVEPFYWDRDGVYDGIKREAADIADDIVAGKIPVELVPVHDTSKVIRTSHSADWVIYAMGFRPRSTIQLSVDTVHKSPHLYNGVNGKLNEVPAAWGFGIAYPNLAPDGVHWDVSVAAFLEHIQLQISDLLSS
ncbi:MAG: hypothetical protein EBU66_11400 [Bacteroidetes bacterium]|nr:hypothetical protein [bacterium]NBP65246.1 hypothetical protein [Bacteroidota bacterium]